MATEKKSFLLRIDVRVWASIERLAAAELRSVNGQIEYLLREALAKRGIVPLDAPAAGQEADSEKD